MLIGPSSGFPWWNPQALHLIAQKMTESRNQCPLGIHEVGQIEKKLKNGTEKN